jgi:hypothetical protein
VPEFIEAKRQAHLANKSDERLFLWSAWLLAKWNERQ